MLKRLIPIFAFAFMALTAGLGTIPGAHAQGILIPDDGGRGRPIGPPMIRPLPNPVQPFYVKNLHITTVINDAVAETTVEQTFVNSGSFNGEATYLYPLPIGASPTAFSMTDGDKTMEPRILPKEEADSIFEGYVRRYRDPALLEYIGHSLVKISIFPIPPQGERIIRMRYTEVLKPENGVHKYVYPLSTSRFGARPVGEATVSIKLHTSAPIKNVYSPSHDLSVRHPEEREATASWEGVNDTSDCDLTLYYSTGNDDVGLSMLTYKSGDKDGYFMLLAAPRVSVPKEKILPKQVVFVLDRTGSMLGPKIEQARKSLLYCLNSLQPDDRFDVITFNESPDVLMNSLQPANAENIGKAKRFVENIEAAGGTNIEDALHAALKLLQNDPGKAKMIVFLTDGLPTVGETNIDTILKHVKEWNVTVAKADDTNAHFRTVGLAPPNGNSARIFCFGLGYDVNVPFLDRLADLGNGDSDYIKPQEDVESRVSSFFAKVASPVLSNVNIAFDGMETYDIYPKTMPDLFKGSQLVVTGRFRGNGAGTVRLSGLTSGSEESFKLAVKSGEADGLNSYIPRIWAQRKLGYLIDQIRLSDNPAGQKEVLDEIVRLSREYGIITEYTSFLIDEPEQRRLGMTPMPTNGSLYTFADINGAISREEVARRALQFGISGEQVTDQSGRAKDLSNSDKAASRYQSSNGSVGIQGDGFIGPGGAAGAPAAGNYQYLARGGGLGGRAGGSGHSPVSRMMNGRSLSEALHDPRNTVLVQSIEDRTFYHLSNSIWQDGSYDPTKQNLVKIQAFSDAHFALIKALPKLAAYSSAGEEVIVRIGNHAIQIGKEGKEKLSENDLNQLIGK